MATDVSEELVTFIFRVYTHKCYLKVMSILCYHSRLVVPRDCTQLAFPTRYLNVLLDFLVVPEAIPVILMVFNHIVLLRNR